jgi:hypothetical protein
MSESIQNPSTGTTHCSCLTLESRRREFLAHAATTYGRPPAVDLAVARELDDLDDAGAILLAFPWLSDPELTEALWALAHF